MIDDLPGDEWVVDKLLDGSARVVKYHVGNFVVLDSAPLGKSRGSAQDLADYLNKLERSQLTGTFEERLQIIQNAMSGLSDDVRTAAYNPETSAIISEIEMSFASLFGAYFNKRFEMLRGILPHNV